MRLIWPIAVTAAWIAGLLVLAEWSATTPALWTAAAVTVASGALVGRWEMLWVPAVIAAVVVVWTLLDGCDPDERCEATPLGYAIMSAGAIGALALLLAAGVAMRKLLDSARRGRV